MSYACPFKMRAWDGTKMVMVQTLCFNDGGSLWYGAGNIFGWAWINPESTGWTKDNPKPTEKDICPVMRWTGLKDKSGVDIYEGDILRIARWDGQQVVYDQIGQVYWWQQAARFSIATDGGLGRVSELNTSSGGMFDPQTRDEVIGNIYANPDLLKT